MYRVSAVPGRGCCENRTRFTFFSNLEEEELSREDTSEDIASSSLVQPAQRLEGAGGDGEPVLVDSFRMADRPDAATPASGGAPTRGASWHGIIKKSSSTGSRAFNKARTGNDRSLVGRKIKLLKTSTLHSRGAGGVVRITSSTPKILNFGVGNSEYVRKEEIGTSWQVLQDSAVTTAPTAAAAAGGGGGGSLAVPVGGAPSRTKCFRKFTSAQSTGIST